jgi:serine/threonine-protein kinase
MSDSAPDPPTDKAIGLAQTMASSAPNPQAPLAIGLAQTMASDVVGAAPAAPVYTTGGAPAFPVPHWDKYEFLELLGRGGMGAVYKARDRRLGRVVALKFISGDDPAMVQRFMQEARAQARLLHPHICKVYEVGSVDNKPYIAMEFVAGQTLDKAALKLSLPEKLRILKDAAQAVHAAHEQGIIHRDLKPSNILVERSGDSGFRPVIMDFGLARDSGGSGSSLFFCVNA